MSRTLWFVCLLAIVAGSGWVLYQRVDAEGIQGVKETLGFGHDPKTQAMTELRKAAQILDEEHGRKGTFRETDLGRFPDLAVVFVSDSQYCIETVKHGIRYHLYGPSGDAVSGSCSAG